MMDANRIYYNFIRPHSALNSQTPAEKAGIDLGLGEGNKWGTANPESESPESYGSKRELTIARSVIRTELGLVRSTSNSNIYYIASDNLLAAKAITYCNKTIGQNISHSTRRCCGNGYGHNRGILLGAKITLPMHDPHVYTIANSTSPSYSILWEVDNASTIPPDCTYADVAVYTGLELNLEKNATGTQHEMDCLSIMYDGHGLADEPYKDRIRLRTWYPPDVQTSPLHARPTQHLTRTTTVTWTLFDGCRVPTVASIEATTRSEHTWAPKRTRRQPRSQS
jgi:hypothetical protein